MGRLGSARYEKQIAVGGEEQQTRARAKEWGTFAVRVEVLNGLHQSERLVHRAPNGHVIHHYMPQRSRTIDYEHPPAQTPDTHPFLSSCTPSLSSSHSR